MRSHVRVSLYYILGLVACCGCTTRYVHVAPDIRAQAYTHVVLARDPDPLNLRPAIADALRDGGLTVIDPGGAMPDNTNVARAMFSYSFERDVFHDTFTYFFLEMRDSTDQKVLATARFTGQSPSSATGILKGLMERLTEELKSAGKPDTRK